jgi:hypothetical protein
MVELFPARTVLATPELLKEDLDLIWIATRPDIQVKILELLKSRNVKILLEKPLARDLKELAELEKLAKLSNCEIYTSQPWRFSDLWLKTKNSLVDLNRLKSTRVSPKLRTFVTPDLDWIAHDLYLLADLGIDPNLLNLEDVRKSEAERTIYFLSSRISFCQFTFSVGFAEIRINRWDFETLKGDSGFIDFDLGISELYDRTGILKHSYKQNPDIHPIHEMIQSYLRGPEPQSIDVFRFYGKILI